MRCGIVLAATAPATSTAHEAMTVAVRGRGSARQVLWQWLGKFEAEQLAPRLRVPAHPREQDHEQDHQRETDHEHDPALEVVQEALGHANAPAIDHHPDAGDAQAVHQDRDRDAGEEEQHALPRRAFVEIGEHQAQRHQREQVAQAVAGLGHLQLVHAEVDDVAFQVDADADQPQEPDTEFGGDQLHAGRELHLQEVRQRDDQEQQQQRHPQVTQGGPTRERQHEAADGDHEPDLLHGVDGRELPDQAEKHAEQHDADADPRALGTRAAPAHSCVARPGTTR